MTDSVEKIERGPTRGKEIAPELADEIARHNAFVDDLRRKFRRDRKRHEPRLRDLEKRRISPRDELQGSGLRRTFVALGRDWAHANFFDIWKDNLKREKIESRKNDAGVLIGTVHKPVICLACFVFCALISIKTFKCRQHFRPKINLPKLEDAMRYATVANYAKSVLDEYAVNGELGLKDRWGDAVDPEVRDWGESLLRRFKNIGVVSVRSVHVDSRAPDLYQVYCEGMMSDPRVIIQCVIDNDKRELVMIE